MRTDSGKNTLVSVIMPVYNQATTLDLSISSICNQTFGDWELILVDDCSTDESLHIMKKKSAKDSRIKIIKNKENFGLAKSLNIGVSNSKGKYIARMDADDISDLNRLKIQVNVLESSSVDVLGSNAVLINSDGYDIGVTDLPLSNSDIIKSIFKRNPFVHSSVIMRKSFLEKANGYDEFLRKKQDYDLWVRGLSFGKYENHKEALIKYTVQEYKPFSTDLYGFYVRIRNGYRGKRLLVSTYWACIVLLINILRKVGYRSEKINW